MKSENRARSIHEPARDTPVAAESDVVVCGGGPAGVAAAVAAARTGASVTLAERYGFLGGMATSGLVRTLSGMGLGGERIVGGVAWEMVERLEAMGGAEVDPAFDSIAVDSEAVKLVCDELAAEAGVRVLLHTYVSAAPASDGRIEAVIVENKSGRAALVGRLYVDATGDGDVGARAGAPWEKGRPEDGKLLPLTTVFRIAGVDTARINRLWRDQIAPNYHQSRIRGLMEEAHAQGRLPLFGGPWVRTYGEGGTRPGQLFVNAVRIGGDATDADSLSRAEMEGRRNAWTFLQFFRQNVPELAEAYLSETGAQIGIRETRRFIGDAVLTLEDVTEGRRPPDTVALGGHPVDIHSPAGDAGQRLIRLEQPYGIPLAALLPRGMANLLMAGRMISADHEAHASLRVMGTAMATGQAAGTAAAMAASLGVTVRRITPDSLRRRLSEDGALV